MPNAENNKKKLFIKTWGCQMNVYDSRRMADILRPFGYEVSEEPEDADMMILNTCHIREKATDKVFSELTNWFIRFPNRDVILVSPPTLAIMFVLSCAIVLSCSYCISVAVFYYSTF